MAPFPSYCTLLITSEAAWYFGRVCLYVCQTITFQSINVGISYLHIRVSPGSKKLGPHIDATLLSRHSDLLLSQITSKFALNIVLASIQFFLGLPMHDLFRQSYHHSSICKTWRNLDNKFQFLQCICSPTSAFRTLSSQFTRVSAGYTGHLLGCTASQFLFLYNKELGRCSAL